ncbi:MAG: hypothetical protein ABGX22_18280 [Pirellulaceae bacterium]
MVVRCNREAAVKNCKSAPKFASTKLFPHAKGTTIRTSLIVFIALAEPKSRGSRADHDFSYEFNVRGEWTSRAQESHKAQIQPYWNSAKTFRTVALDELNRLEKRVKEKLANQQAAVVWTLGGPTGADPPVPAIDSIAPDSVTQDVLKQALAEIATRRNLTKAHYTEMQAAAVAAFPMLAKIVADSDHEQ